MKSAGSNARLGGGREGVSVEPQMDKVRFRLDWRRCIRKHCPMHQVLFCDSTNYSKSDFQKSSHKTLNLLDADNS